MIFDEQFARERQENIPDCVQSVIKKNYEFVYLPGQKILFFTMAKSGTTTLFHWIYKLLSGFPTGWNRQACRAFVQNPHAGCWNRSIRALYTIPRTDRVKILASKDVLKVAIQRDPYARLISSFKSKYTCERERFKTDVHEQMRMVQVLRSKAGMQDASLSNGTQNCMSISEFAQALDNCRRRYNNSILTLRTLDVHVRPQLYCFHQVDFDMIIDVKDLSQESVMLPIYERLISDRSHINLSVPERKHTSTGSEGLGLMIPAKAATQLHKFAKLSQPAPLKYLSSYQPVQEEEGQD